MPDRDKKAKPPTKTSTHPLIFGVSGHRDPASADVPQLRDQLQVVFSRFRAAYPKIPFELLSPLAEGADRLAAEVALSCQIKLRVPMPLAQEEYERDFPSAASLGEFRRLLAVAESYWEVPGTSGSPESDTKSRSAQSRAERYAAMGDLIARRSHVLILLWDGRDNDKIGGTAWVKRRREYWVSAVAELRDLAETLGYDPTLQIVTPRAAPNASAQGRPRVEIIGNLPAG
jgi:hypothetical protein